MRSMGRVRGAAASGLARQIPPGLRHPLTLSQLVWAEGVMGNHLTQRRTRSGGMLL